MADKEAGRFVMTFPAPVVNVAVLKPHSFTDPRTKKAADPRYGVTFLLAPDHPDLPGIKKVMVSVAKEAFPGLDIKLVGFPIRSGDKANEKRVAKGKTPYEAQAGKVLLPARNARQPLLSGMLNGKPTDLTEESAILVHGSKLFHGGAECLGQLNFVAYGEVEALSDNGGGIRPAVTCYLNHLFSTGKGARLGGGAPARETFSGYVGAFSQEDPTGGVEADDDIPL